MDWDIFSTYGRIRRTHYFVYSFILGIATAALQMMTASLIGGVIGSLLYLCCLVPLTYASVCVAVRRAHDWGKSGQFVAWLYASGFAAAVFIFIGLVLLFTMGPLGVATIAIGAMLALANLVMALFLAFGPPTGDNEWGADPR